MLFLLRKLLSKRDKLKSKTSGSKISKTFKLIGLGLGLIIVLSILVVIAVDVSSTDTNSDGKKSNRVFVSNADSPIKDDGDDGLYEDNPDGTINGLNLLLINKIETRGYVKEYLNLCLSLQEGKLGPLNVYPSVARTLGVAATEQGSYSGLPILGSPLPTDSNGPIWDESKNLTLSTAYREILFSTGYTDLIDFEYILHI